jgi:hypothetical protein
MAFVTILCLPYHGKEGMLSVTTKFLFSMLLSSLIYICNFLLLEKVDPASFLTLKFSLKANNCHFKPSSKFGILYMSKNTIWHKRLIHRFSKELYCECLM